MEDKLSASDIVKSLIGRFRSEPLDPYAAARIFDWVLSELVQQQHQSVFWGDRMLTLDKSATFRDEPAFREALTKAASSTGQNQYRSPDGIGWRYNTLIWAARTCLALPGDFVECGVFRGDMSWMVVNNVDLRNSGKTLYLYDTFAGFDPRYSSEDDFSEAPQIFAVADKEYRAADIEDHVRQRFRDYDYVQVHKGSVPDVLHGTAPAQIAFLHLDLNSPRAETGALEVLFDRIATGGVIVFDDYGWKVFRKQKEAADDFMAARGQVILELPTGQGMMVKR